MPQFAYTAKDTNGRTVSGTLEYESVTNLIEALRQQGLVILNVKQEHKAVGGISVHFLQKRVRLDDIVLFTRMLATMVDSGIPLVQGLDILHEQIDHPDLKRILLQVKNDVEKGSSFSNALAHHKKAFSPLYISMVRAGESSGSLDEILERLAIYLEKMNNLIKKVKSALIYPALVTVIAIAIVIFMLVVVIPVFKGIYSSFNAELPFATRILLGSQDPPPRSGTTDDRRRQG